MLGKMFIHGLVAAVVIGSAAAVYAQAKDNGYLSPAAAETTAQAAAQTPPQTTAPAAGNGYVRPAFGDVRRHDEDRRHERKGEGRTQRDRHHDDD